MSGNGSDAKDLKTTRNRAKRKSVSQIMALELIKIAQKENNLLLEKRFRNTYYCLEEVFCADGRIYGKFCKNRVCTVCLAIRKAELINKYCKDLYEWPEPYLLTLTVKSVKANRLRVTILNMKIALTKIIKTYNKRHLRGKGPKLSGLYSLECNFNPKTKTYNPHFHIITINKETADLILTEWLNRARPGKVVRWAQNLQIISDRKNALIEVIKYGTKIMTENDLDKRIRDKSKRSIYIRALYTIVEAFLNIRVFEHFGFTPKKLTKEYVSPLMLTEYEKFIYSPEKKDWIEFASSKPLTGYIPSVLTFIPK